MEFHIQNEAGLPCPAESQLQLWARTALAAAGIDTPSEITLRITAEEEMQALNQRYRKRDTSTNVLSFAARLPAELELPLLGDIVICAPVVAREARQQGKPEHAHWAHMVVHGILHLLGYDHIDEEGAASMEQLETAVLATLHFPPPYQQPEMHRHETGNT